MTKPSCLDKSIEFLSQLIWYFDMQCFHDQFPRKTLDSIVRVYLNTGNSALVHVVCSYSHIRAFSQGRLCLQ